MGWYHNIWGRRSSGATKYGIRLMHWTLGSRKRIMTLGQAETARDFRNGRKKMRRETYNNGQPIQLKENGCDGCKLAVIDGILCHETGCPFSWNDNAAECRECGCDFMLSEKNQTVCDECAAAADPDFIPAGIEVFYRTAKENRADGWEDSDGDTLGAGWYWWSCFPGCLPDSDPFGPFDSEREAIDDCRGL